MAVELFIEDKPVDLTGEENIALDYAIAKIGEIQTRTGARSVQFNLLKTTRNRAIFENPDDVNNLSTIPYRKLKARLYADGIDQQIAFCTLEESAEAYNCRLYGVEVGFFDKLKDKKLTGLNLSSLDYFHTYNNVAAKRHQTDVCFPITWAFDKDEAYDIGDTRYMPCGLGVEYLLGKICSEQGYTLTNSVCGKYGYPSRFLCIPFTNEKWVRDSSGYFYEAVLHATTSAPYVGKNVVEFNTIVGNASNYWSGMSTWNGAIFFCDKVDVTFDIELKLTPGAGFSNPLTVGILVGGIPFSGGTQTFTLSPGVNTINWSKQFEITPNYASLTAQVSVYYSCAGAVTMSGPATLVIRNVTIKEPYEVLREYAIAGPGGLYNVLAPQYVTPQSMLPDISQAELLKTYCQLFCAFIQVNEAEKSVRILCFNDIASNAGKCSDWSDKLDNSTSPAIKYIVDNYARTNSFKWQYVEEDSEGKPLRTGYADSNFYLSDANLPAESEAVNLKFCASEMITVGAYTVCHVRNFDTDAVLTGRNKASLVIIEFNNGSFTYKDSDQFVTVTGNIPLTYFNNGGNYDLGFQYLLPAYYNQFAAVLDNYRQVTCQLRLNAADINQLDFTRPVYIKHFNAYFYINTIKGYTPMQPGSTTVELIKLF